MQDFRQIELLAAPWLDPFIEHTCLASENDNDIPSMARSTLTELMNNNMQLLEEAITDEKMKLFESLLLKTRDSRTLDLLTALCYCNKTPVISNQGKNPGHYDEDVVTASSMMRLGRVDCALCRPDFADFHRAL